MLTKRFYYAGAITQVVTCFIHLLGHFQNPAPTNETEKTLFDLFQNYKFDLGAGFMRSLGELFAGFSLMFSLFSLSFGIISIVAWRTLGQHTFTKKLTWINVFCFALFSIDGWVYFFLPPLTLIALTFVFYLGAALTWKDNV